MSHPKRKKEKTHGNIDDLHTKLIIYIFVSALSRTPSFMTGILNYSHEYYFLYLWTFSTFSTANHSGTTPERERCQSTSDNRKRTESGTVAGTRIGRVCRTIILIHSWKRCGAGPVFYFLPLLLFACGGKFSLTNLRSLRALLRGPFCTLADGPTADLCKWTRPKWKRGDMENVAF